MRQQVWGGGAGWQAYEVYHKCVRSNNIKSSNTKQTFGVIYTGDLQHLSSNGHSGIHRVADYIDDCMWTMLCNTFNQCAHNSSIDIEQVIPCHSWLPWDSSWNYNQIHPIQCRAKLILPKIASHLYPPPTICAMDLFCITDIQDMQEKHIVICLQSNAKEKQESCKEHDEQHTTAEVLVWLRSAVTPGVLKTSYKCKVDTSGFILSSKLKGCPMPPAAPNTATLNPGAAPCALVGSLSNPPILSP